MQINLSTLAVILGLGLAVTHVPGVVKPAAYAVWLRKFPRSLPWGIALMLLGTGWFVYYLNQESISDFAAYKPLLLGGFAAVGIASCIFVQDFLAVRGLAVVLLVLAKMMVDTARWAPTDWRLVICSLAYIWVAAGIWFTMYPWHLRDILAWETASVGRLRAISTVRVVFGLFVAVLGFTVYKSV